MFAFAVPIIAGLFSCAPSAVELGHRAYNAGDPVRAVDMWLKIVEKEPEDTRARDALDLHKEEGWTWLVATAEQRVAEGKLDEAEGLLTTAKALEERLVEVQELDFVVTRRPEVLARYEDARAAAWFTTAQSEVKAGKGAEATKNLDGVLQIRPQTPDLVFWQAEARRVTAQAAEAEGRWLDAKADYWKAWELGYGPAHEPAEEIARALGEWAIAAGHCRTAHDLFVEGKAAPDRLAAAADCARTGLIIDPLVIDSADPAIVALQKKLQDRYTLTVQDTHGKWLEIYREAALDDAKRTETAPKRLLRAISRVDAVEAKVLPEVVADVRTYGTLQVPCPDKDLLNKTYKPCFESKPVDYKTHQEHQTWTFTGLLRMVDIRSGRETARELSFTRDLDRVLADGFNVADELVTLGAEPSAVVAKVPPEILALAAKTEPLPTGDAQQDQLIRWAATELAKTILQTADQDALEAFPTQVPGLPAPTRLPPRYDEALEAAKP